LTTMLLNELQKEHHQVEAQQQQIDDLTDRLTKLERGSQTQQALYSPALTPKR
jgi:hypothetical protein